MYSTYNEDPNNQHFWDGQLFRDTFIFSLFIIVSWDKAQDPSNHALNWKAPIKKAIISMLTRNVWRSKSD